MAELIVVGVRHHSPACARLVQHVLRTRAPRYVLIEGPCNMNPRLDELRLEHRLPVAVYTYHVPAHQVQARGVWAPFCDYSPEWVALQEGSAAGAQVRFIDLPAWDDAFANTQNVYSDAHLQMCAQEEHLAERCGFDSTDSLWDHLFEQDTPMATLQADLENYFSALRGPDAASPQAARREAWMAQWIAWAMAQAQAHESVLVVCGGYHKPALERLWPQAPTQCPTLAPCQERVGSYLVPFSFQRLDSFAGYDAGMPSPAFYQERWERGPACIDSMLLRTVARLRSRGQQVSTANAQAAHELAHGLAQLRGHAAPTRTDLLDGLAGALIKEPLRCPAPWSVRGPLLPDTDPILVEIVATFAGAGRGVLAAQTPRPPLALDVTQALERVGLALSAAGTTVEIDPLDASVVQRRAVLYQLSILEISGVQRVQAATHARGAPPTPERWRLQETDTTACDVIEQAAYGPTLEQAAAAKILALLRQAPGVAPLAAGLEQAMLAGFASMATDLAEHAMQSVHRETQFTDLGAALPIFLNLAHASTRLVPLLTAACTQAVWLLEGMHGPRAHYNEAQVRGVLALRDCLHTADLLPANAAALAYAALDRRVRSPHTPPALRGAALGTLWSTQSAHTLANAASAAAVTQAVPTAMLGDFLSGLLALAREAFVDSPLIHSIDARLSDMAQEEFFAALPALRHAFAFLPPRERLAVAEQLVPAPHQDAEALLRTAFAAPTVQAGARLQAAVLATAATYNLLEPRFS